jgi:hypothetical protein
VLRNEIPSLDDFDFDENDLGAIKRTFHGIRLALEADVLLKKLHQCQLDLNVIVAVGSGLQTWEERNESRMMVLDCAYYSKINRPWSAPILARRSAASSSVTRILW